MTGDDVTREVFVRAPADAVFDLFVEPAGLVRWIGIAADLDPRPGGTFRFEIEPGQFCEGEFVAVERPRRVAFTWGWTEPAMGVPPGTSLVEVDLREGDGGTHVRLVHRGLPPQARPMHGEGWDRFLPRLVATAEAEEGAPCDR